MWITDWWHRFRDEEQRRVDFWDGLSCSRNGTLTCDLGKLLLSERGSRLLADIAAIRTASNGNPKP